MTSRREFLQVALTSGGGLLVGCRSLDPAAAAPPLAPPAAVPSPPVPSGPARFGAYVEIAPDGRIVIVCPQSEMGQGVHDGLPKIVAEELDADWSRVQVQLPHADEAFVNPTTRRQRTANSESTLVYYEPLRLVGATAREMLVAAAAARWGVGAEECTTRASQVIHAASGRSVGYGDLAADAATRPVPAQPRLKDPATFTLIGRATPRKDTPAKTDGSAIFGIDVQLPGMLHGALRRSSCVAAKTLGFDRAAALKRPGVVDAFPIPDGIAVVGESSWLARQAAEALDVQFDESGSAGVDSTAMRARMIAALDHDELALQGRAAFGGPPFDRAAALAAIAAAPIRKEWRYEVPFLAHAALEPLCATAVVREDSCEVWAPTQQADRARDAMAQITGLPLERCRLNVTFLGGGFGRKWELDFIRQSVQVALGVRGRPVKLTWTREQDFQHDRYRPAHIARTRVGLSRDGAILGMHSRITGISMWKYQGRTLQPGMADPFATGLLINDRYDFPNRFADFVETPEPVPVGTWRSVSQSMNGFFFESVVDDIAAATRRDPLALRIELLAKDPRAVAVLKLAAERAGWGRKLPRGHGMGIAFGAGFGACCAEVVEVSVQGRQLKVERITCAFDCGTIVDPRNVEAQVEGGIVWGLSAALNGQIHFDAGAARETNFDRGPILRMHEMPRIDVHLVRSTNKPGGCGEASVPPVAPALTAAIYAATGQRPRRLPLTEAGFG